MITFALWSLFTLAGATPRLPDWFTRQAALKYALPTLAEWFARGLHLNSSWLRKQVGDAGEPSRFVFTDHLMFYARGMAGPGRNG